MKWKFRENLFRRQPSNTSIMLYEPKLAEQSKKLAIDGLAFSLYEYQCVCPVCLDVNYGHHRHQKACQGDDEWKAQQNHRCITWTWGFCSINRTSWVRCVYNRWTCAGARAGAGAWARARAGVGAGAAHRDKYTFLLVPVPGMNRRCWGDYDKLPRWWKLTSWGTCNDAERNK